MAIIGKQQLLDRISPERKSAVEPLIDQVLWFYGDNLELDKTDHSLSSFVREVKHLGENMAPLPFGRIFISDQGYPEEALVHELLHLSMPLHHGVYGFGFEVDNEPAKELTSLINNVLEHDLFMSDYLQFGYSLDRFLGEGSYLNMDYKKRIKEGGTNQVYWMNEYLRLSITMQHLSEEKKAVCRKGIENVRKISLSTYPELQHFYHAIRQWLINKSFHVQGQYFQSVVALYKIMRIRQSVKFITPRGEQAITVIYADRIK